MELIPSLQTNYGPRGLDYVSKGPLITHLGVNLVRLIEERGQEQQMQVIVRKSYVI